MWRSPTPITLVLLVLHRGLSRLLGPVHLPILLLCEQGVTRDLKHQDCCIDFAVCVVWPHLECLMIAGKIEGASILLALQPKWRSQLGACG